MGFPGVEKTLLIENIAPFIQIGLGVFKFFPFMFIQLMVNWWFGAFGGLDS